MDELKIKLEKVRLCRGRVEVLLPEGFKDMPDYLAKKKYPSKHRPPIILMNENNLVNYTFHLMEKPLPWSQLEIAAKSFVKNLKLTMPQAKFDELEFGERRQGKIAWITYESMAIDADIFNLVFLTAIEGKLLYGSFNCVLELKEQWKDIAMQSILSIEEVGEE